MENKQTAVQQLIEQLIKYELVPKGIHPDNILFHTALETEKKQKQEEYLRGYKEGINSGSTYHPD